MHAALTLQFSKSTEADQAVSALQGLLPMIKIQTSGSPYAPLVEAIEFRVHDTDLTIAVQLSPLDVEDLVKALSI